MQSFRMIEEITFVPANLITKDADMILYDMGVADYCQEENRKRPLLRNPNLIRAILFYHALKSFYLAYLCSETIVSPRNDLIFIVLGDFGYI